MLKYLHTNSAFSVAAASSFLSALSIHVGKYLSTVDNTYFVANLFTEFYDG